MDRRSTRRSLRALLIGLAVDNFGTGLFLPLSLVYAIDVVGLTLGTAGTLVSLGLAVGLLVPPVAGPMVDRFGPRAVVVFSQALQAIGAFAYLVAQGPALVFVGSVFLAIGSQTFYCSLFALVGDSVPDGPKDRAFLLLNIVRGAGFGLGALVAGVLISGASTDGYRIAVGADAVTFLVCVAILSVYVRAGHAPTAANRAGRMGSVWRDRPYLGLILVSLLAGLTVDFFVVGMPVYVLSELDGPRWLPGAIIALLTTCGVVGGLASIRVVAALRRTTAMALRSCLFAVWCLASLLAVKLPAAWHVPYLLAITLVLAAASVLGPMANALAEAAAPRHSRGRYLATYQYAYTVAAVVTPAVVALFKYAVWLPWTVVTAAALLAAAGSSLLASRLPASVQSPGPSQ